MTFSVLTNDGILLGRAEHECPLSSDPLPCRSRNTSDVCQAT